MSDNKCECRKCIPVEQLLLFPRLVVCSICGNKRCPHANDHDFECTNSNEPGQEGGYYE
jgi:hypothetical protein